MIIQGRILNIVTMATIVLTNMFASPVSAINLEAEKLRIQILHDREVRAIDRAKEYHETIIAFQQKVSMINSSDEVRRQSKIALKSIQETINLYRQEIDLVADLLSSADREYYLWVIRNRQAFIEMLEKEKTKWQGFLQKGMVDPPKVQRR
jgi:hypothetical protein